MRGLNYYASNLAPYLLTYRCSDLREYNPNEEKFCNRFSVSKFPGDGHCFIHSLSTSIASMHPPEHVSNDAIL